ncbi:MAG: PepSY domain-containing protein [Rhizobiales bacterium]|nr:PepSY domain-containing protein [Hyphomicrobiales bacterium]
MKIIGPCIGLALLAATPSLADAAKKATNDAGPIGTAKLSLESAVSIAEKHGKGKAVRAEYEKQKDGTWVYDIEVKSEDVVTDIKVDPEKGAVLASAADHNDDDDGEDRAD